LKSLVDNTFHGLDTAYLGDGIHCVAIKAGSSERIHLDYNDDKVMCWVFTLGEVEGSYLCIPQFGLKFKVRNCSAIGFFAARLAHFTTPPTKGQRVCLTCFTDKFLFKHAMKYGNEPMPSSSKKIKPAPVLKNVPCKRTFVEMDVESEDEMAPGPVIVEGIVEWKIDHIMAERMMSDGSGKEYWVLWEGYDMSEAEWLPEKELEQCEALDKWQFGTRLGRIRV
jgi:hypothetical protein